LKKEFILDNDEVDGVLTEKRVFLAVDRHPFLVNLYACLQSEHYVYFVMEFVAGGDLMFHIQQRMFTEEQARFYAAEILLALEYLHSKHIVYRDLKLDNILLNTDGHLKLADYGLCKENIHVKKATTFCGTPEFIAPEILREEAYGFSVDWWSFGVLLYEMLIGEAPFKGTDEEDIFESILHDEVKYPPTLSFEAVTLLRDLLQRNIADRLGCGPNDALDVKNHPFFHDIQFHELLAKPERGPFLPSLKSPMDLSHFDSEFTALPAILTPTSTVIHPKDQEEFQGLTWTRPKK
jgi:serine/threonine protein kinase